MTESRTSAMTRDVRTEQSGVQILNVSACLTNDRPARNIDKRRRKIQPGRPRRRDLLETAVQDVAELLTGVFQMEAEIRKGHKGGLRR